MKITRLLIPFLFLIHVCTAQQKKARAHTNNSGPQAKTTDLNCNNWLQLNAEPSFVNIGKLDIAGNQLTVEASFNRTSIYSDGVVADGDLVSKHSSPADVNYLLRPTNALITTSDGFFQTPYVCDIELNKTYHVAMTYDGAMLKFYRNGFLMSQVSATGTLFQNNLDTHIGLLSSANLHGNFVGYENEVRIWNVVRTQAQIRAYMNTSLPSPATQTGLQAYYIFNDLINKQGNPAWNGTLSGPATINNTVPDCSFTPDSCAKIVMLPPSVVIPAFNAPDTVCVNTPVKIANTSSGASTYYWNFCVADLNTTPPNGVNLGNPGNALVQPAFIDYVKDNGNYYGFVTNYTPGGLSRLDFGNSLLNTPTATYLGNFGGAIPANIGAEGVQIIKNEGKWYVIVVGGYTPSGSLPRISKIEFGTSLTNPNPVATNWGNIGNLYQPLDLHVFNDGNNWYGFTVNAENNTITRFDFTNSFDNIPTAINLGNLGNLAYPTGIYAINDNGFWRLFITNGGANTRTTGIFSLTRLDFGSSLLNTPTAVNLGNPGNKLQHPRDLTIMKSCGQIIGFVVNGHPDYNDVVKLDFNNDLVSTPTAVSLGNIGNLDFPPCISKLFRSGNDLYGFVTNVGSNSITRLQFTGCTNSSIPNSIAQNPPDVTYNIPGTYNINLSVDDGLGTQAAFCKQVVVLPPPVHTPLQRIISCNTDSIKIGTGIKQASYLWNTGAITDSIFVKNSGTYIVQVSRFGCSDIDSIQLKSACIATCANKEDFNYTIDVCNPLSVTFQSSAISPVSIQWTLDDGTVITGNSNPMHSFVSAGNHTVIMITYNGTCTDTVTKVISTTVTRAKIILTKDTTICPGSTLQINTSQSLGFCWSPTTFLSDPNSSNPTSSPLQNITYYYTAQIQGSNLIVNGDFSGGNTGFTSEYNYATPNLTEAQYFVGTNPSLWNSGMSACSGHTTGNDNMLLVNGAPVPGVNVWKETIAVTPNTNYVFSTWVQALYPPNPAQLQFSFNGKPVGSLITASLPTCTWTQFYTTWNSGNNTSVIISIVNQNTFVQGNDFALDDISFARVFAEQDSLVIKIDSPNIRASNDTTICPAKQVQLNATGNGTVFNWSPSTGLSNPAIFNPVATPVVSTQYIVSGTTAAGCTVKDTVNITVNPAPVITRTNDTTICHDKTIQLNASGGSIYSWQPSPTLSNTNISNPVASPANNTTYYLTVTSSAGCLNSDSVKVSVKPPAVFAATTGLTACKGSPVQLAATGGNIYSWQPADGLNNTNIATPLATPDASTIYTVKIIESTCKDSASLSSAITILSLPQVKATSSNDVNCTKPATQLNATGALYYVWQPANSLNDSIIAAPLASPSGNTAYVVKGTDLNGCNNYDSVSVLVTHAGDLLVNIPNAFTPNGDGKNDCFGVSRYAGLLQNVQLSVYDRFGVRVFYTTNPLNCWDGRYNGTLQNAGGFVYVLQANTFCGVIFKKGIVMLIR